MPFLITRNDDGWFRYVLLRLWSRAVYVYHLLLFARLAWLHNTQTVLLFASRQKEAMKSKIVPVQDQNKITLHCNFKPIFSLFLRIIVLFLLIFSANQTESFMPLKLELHVINWRDASLTWTQGWVRKYWQFDLFPFLRRRDEKRGLLA